MYGYRSNSFLCLLSAMAFFFSHNAFAEPTLMGRTVSLQVITYDDPSHPAFSSATHTARVIEGIEFGLARQGGQGDIDVVPLLVNIGANRIELNYSVSNVAQGSFSTAIFNGYVLNFSTDCDLFGRAHINEDLTNLPLTNDNISSGHGVLLVNVSGMQYTRQSRIVLNLDVNDCPIEGRGESISSSKKD